MQRFASLFAALDRTNKTNEKTAALESYFREAQPSDAAWAIFLLSGRKVRQIIPIRKLCEWAAAVAGTPGWMFEECYENVGDLAETVTLILPEALDSSNVSLTEWMEKRLIPLRDADEVAQKNAMCLYWNELNEQERFVLHKLLTGAFRVGVSQRLVTRALANCLDVEVDVVAHRMMGDWTPSAAFFESLTDSGADEVLQSKPYPFYLAHPLANSPESLGDVSEWQAEWKWDGIRAQLIRRAGETYIWSRGEELMTDRFPELLAAADELPDGIVLDGEVLAWKDGVLPFAIMQKRIGRKKLGKKILAEAPVVMMVFDLLEHDGQDIRSHPLSDRRQRLSGLIGELATDSSFRLSERVQGEDWESLAETRQTSRQHRTEGLMLKRLNSPYRAGRPRGDWWKWKIEPYTIDAVLIYAQRGTGRRANLYTDYTFALWDEGELVPFAKAYSGLTDDEINEVDAFVRRSTIERFGPVRAVTPELVFEIAFENIQSSKRHKSGVAVRFPRIARWRRDLNIHDADTLNSIRNMAVD